MAVTQEIFEKLEILTDAAKYDVACTSSGSSRKGRQGMMGNTVAGGNLPLFCGRWQVYFSFEDFADQ